MPTRRTGGGRYDAPPSPQLIQAIDVRHLQGSSVSCWVTLSESVLVGVYGVWCCCAGPRLVKCLSSELQQLLLADAISIAQVHTHSMA
jgi:hypothetical protein